MIRILLLVLLVAGAEARGPRHYREKVSPAGQSLTKFQTNSTIFTGTGGASASDVINVWAGTQSNRLAVGGSSVVFFQQTISPTANICTDSTFRVTYYFKNKANTTNNGVFQLYVGSNTSNYWTYDFAFAARDTNLTYYANGFTSYYIPRRKMTVVGTPDCTNIGIVFVSLKAQVALVDTVTLGEVASAPTRLPRAALVLTVDDQWSSFADSGGYRAWDTLGYHYSMFINPGLLGVANKMSAFQLDSIHRKYPGVDFCNHCWIHDTLSSISADSLTRSIRMTHDWLHSRGYRGTRFFAQPFGDVSQNRIVDSVTRNCGYIDFSRVTKGNILGEPPPFSNPFAMRALAGLGSGITEAQLETVVNDIISSKTAGILYGHKLGATAVDGNTWAAADWRTFTTFVKGKVNAGTLDVMSLSEYFDAYGGDQGPVRRMGSGP